MVSKYLTQAGLKWERLDRALGRRKKAAATRLFVYRRNLGNLVRYGPGAPRYGELIRVDPAQIERVLPFGAFGKDLGAREVGNLLAAVLHSDKYFKGARPIDEDRRVRICRAHWVYNLSWEETGLYAYEQEQLEKGRGGGRYRSMEDVKKRFENLDRIFEQVKKEGRLRSAAELPGEDNHGNRETVVHVGPGGEPLWGGGGGNHRFVIAYILKVPLYVRLGCVYAGALGSLDGYRRDGSS